MRWIDNLGAIAIAIVLSALVVFSRMTELPNGDALLPSVISLQKVTAYYWGQNRVGNLLPFLLSPISDIEANYYLQVLCRALGAALTPAFLILVLQPKIPATLSFSAALVAIFSLMRHEALLPYWQDAAQYGLALAFAALSAFMLMSRWSHLAVRLPLSVGFGLLASWLNVGVVGVTAPVYLALAFSLRSWRHAGLFVVSIICFLAETFHSSRYGGTGYSALSFSPGQQIAGLYAAIDRSLYGGLLALFASTGVVLAWGAVKPSEARRHVSVVGALLVSVLLVAATNWFRINDYHPRYISMPIALIVGAAGIAVAEIAYNSGRFRWLKAALIPSGIAAVLVSCIWSVTPLLPHRLTADATHTIAAKAIRENVHLIAGDYWQVWPAVFETSRLAREPNIYGLTGRGLEMKADIRASLTRNPRVMCVGDPESCQQILVLFSVTDASHIGQAMVPVESGSDPQYSIYDLR